MTCPRPRSSDISFVHATCAHVRLIARRAPMDHRDRRSGDERETARGVSHATPSRESVFWISGALGVLVHTIGLGATDDAGRRHGGRPAARAAAREQRVVRHPGARRERER